MLTFNLKKEWFEKIKSGEKTHEYREVSEYWNKRLFSYRYEYFHTQFPEEFPICFACGYPKKDDKEKRLYAKIKDINVVWGEYTDLKIQRNVFDIEFELIGDKDD